MIPKLTDDAVSRLPLEAGRAELLEEIMRADAPERPVSDPTAAGASSRALRRWLVPLAAAAAIAAIALSSMWWRDAGQDPRGSTSTPVATGTPASSQDHRAVLDAPGWQVTHTVDQDEYGSTVYEKSGQSLEITWYPAASYDEYVEDREYIVDPPAPGAPIEVMGRDAQMWAYNATEHTAIREVENGHWMEVRGSGMQQAEYLELVGRLRLVDLAGYEQALPDSFVDSSERGDTVRDMLRGITDASGAGWPVEQHPAAVHNQQDPYQLGAEVAGSYACAWLEEFQDATKAGDTARADEAARVLGTSRAWPILLEMDERGDYPEVIWDYARTVANGEVPEGYREGLGCP